MSGFKVFRVWIRALPIVLLIVVASLQYALVRGAALSPWSGGGFGMFSTLDHGSRRHLHAFIVRPGLRREVILSRAHADQVKRALALPTRARLADLAGIVAEIPTADYGPARAVQIQVWNTHFGPQTLTPVSRVLREFVLPLDHEN